MTDRESFIYDEIVELGVATNEEINLVRNIMSGSWEDVLNAIIYARTGYHTYNQLCECECEEED